MRQKWISIFSLALLMLLVSADVASAKKSRSSHAAARGHVKKEARGGRTSKAKGKISKRESSRREKVARGKASKSGKHSRYVARGRRGKHRGYVAETRTADSPPSRPASSGIPSERAIEIQKALIKAGYMDGPPSGQYDEATTQAMKQYQSANGFPQTGLPSAALLKKLGVPKRSSDGYAVPVNTVSESEKKHPPQ
jgi:Putative peptidoglycan binding domain